MEAHLGVAAPGLKADLLDSLHREYLWVLDCLGM